ncbi:protein RALF-like 32 [Telopea speciosissima]|uniref:protein RALF-like 32 n=1 Tax=Telopea speciosissima TaxID=54955 RepID=UPI001CC52FE2|nr:protein RALF-like 32 [Telopea speciosissima]
MVFSATLITTSDAYLRCNGSIAECNEEEELLMESEIAGRFLQERQYIFYGAVKPNQPVCGGGASGEAYTKTDSCQPPPSNPQNRGCSKYYRCRTDS